MRIVIASAGHIGVALAALLSLRNEMTFVDIDPQRVDVINAGCVVSGELELSELLRNSATPLRATFDVRNAHAEVDCVVVTVHTDYDERFGTFDTTQVNEIVQYVSKVNPSAIVVVKSTLSVGYTDGLHERFPAMHLLYCPEFLREGQEAHDCLNPTRIVVGVPDSLPLEGGSQVEVPTRDDLLNEAHRLAAMFVECSRAGADDGADVVEDAEVSDDSSDIPVFVMSAAEAEAVKLFSNAYLAMRVAYFNELDGFCEARGIEADSAVRAVCADHRIGDYYNNPSFGYGGGCLPKDSRQLLADLGDAPHALARAIVESNELRQECVAATVEEHINVLRQLGTHDPVVGLYGLSMKSGVADARSSSSLGVAAHLRAKGVRVIVYDPSLGCGEFSGFEVVQSFERFKHDADPILANRLSDELADVAGKVYSRDLFGRD